MVKAEVAADRTRSGFTPVRGPKQVAGHRDGGGTLQYGENHRPAGHERDQRLVKRLAPVDLVELFDQGARRLLELECSNAQTLVLEAGQDAADE